MIVENLKVYNFDEAIRASKFPKLCDTFEATGRVTNTVEKLATSAKGEGHDNFLCGIVVSFDLTFTNKAWIEMERYHFIDIVSSQSTMHKISAMYIPDLCNEYVDKRIIDVVEELRERYLVDSTPENYLKLLYSVPSGLQLTAHIVTNYRQLKTIYSQRWNHRLPEWRDFCGYMRDNLPHGNWIAGEMEEVKTPLIKDELGPRLYNLLCRNNVNYYEDLRHHTANEVKHFRNLGDKGFQDLTDIVKKHGIEFMKK